MTLQLRSFVPSLSWQSIVFLPSENYSTKRCFLIGDWGKKAYLTQLPAAVKAGKVSQEDLDRALLRLTTLQMELGLFDPKADSVRNTRAVMFATSFSLMKDGERSFAKTGSGQAL
eukprot:COSAG06_NODE_1888_length_8136_cov_87.834889_5_plen_115_part_00